MARNGGSGSKRARNKPSASKPKQERKKKEPPATRRITAETLSDAQRQHLTFQYKNKIIPLLDAEAAAKSAVTKMYEQAKKEGIPKKDIKLAIAFETEEGEEGQAGEVERILRIARWSGAKLGTQFDMFGGPAKGRDAVFDEGRNAALRDEPARAPAHLGGKSLERWLQGHAQGRTELNAIRGEGFKALGHTVEDLAHKAGISASLGTSPPSHAEMEGGEAGTMPH